MPKQIDVFAGGIEDEIGGGGGGADAGPATATEDGTRGTTVHANDSDTTSRDKSATPAGVAAQIAANASSGGSQQVLHVRDEKAYNAAAGTFTANAWRTRDLNTVVKNTIPGAGLSSNRITLPAGTYDIFAALPAYAASAHLGRLFSITTNSTLLFGMQGYDGDAGYAQSISLIIGRFQLTTTEILELQHISTGNGSFGGGNMVTTASKILSSVFLRRVS